MATANKSKKNGKPEAVKGTRYSIYNETCPDGFDWHVTGAEGDMESYETRDEAVAGAHEYEEWKSQEEAADAEEMEEDAEEAREEQREEIRGLLDDADAETLAAVLALLKR